MQIYCQRFYLLWAQIRKQSFRHDYILALALVRFSVNVRQQTPSVASIREIDRHPRHFAAWTDVMQGRGFCSEQITGIGFDPLHRSRQVQPIRSGVIASR
jgi:hypothetical protein